MNLFQQRHIMSYKFIILLDHYSELNQNPSCTNYFMPSIYYLFILYYLVTKSAKKSFLIFNSTYKKQC